MSDFPVMSDYELDWPYWRRKSVVSWRDTVAWVKENMVFEYLEDPRIPHPRKWRR